MKTAHSTSARTYRAALSVASSMPDDTSRACSMCVTRPPTCTMTLSRSRIRPYFHLHRSAPSWATEPCAVCSRHSTGSLVRCTALSTIPALCIRDSTSQFRAHHSQQQRHQQLQHRSQLCTACVQMPRTCQWCGAGLSCMYQQTRSCTSGRCLPSSASKATITASFLPACGRLLCPHGERPWQRSIQSCGTTMTISDTGSDVH